MHLLGHNGVRLSYFLGSGHAVESPGLSTNLG